MDLFIVRHGESLANKIGMLQGQLNVDLTEVGFEQAKKLAIRLKDFDFDLIYSSDLRRALNTANEINKFHEKKIIIDNRIREKTNGKEDGRLHSTLSEFEKEKFSEDPNFKFEEGESVNEFLERIKIFYEKEILKSSNKNKKILIVCHGGVIKALMSLLNKKFKVENTQEMRIWKTENTCLYHIKFLENNTFNLEKKNCTEHLN